MRDAHTLVNRNEFRDAIFDFFDRKRGGHLDKYAYVMPHNWENLVKAAQQGRSKYYLARPEIEVPVLEKIAQKENLNRGNGQSITQIFEMGPGTGQKIIPFVQNIQSLQSGILIDYEMENNHHAHDKIRQIRPDLPLTLIQQDFEAPRSRTRISGNTLGLVLGGTICNMGGMPEEFSQVPSIKLTKRFNNVANFYHEGGYLIVTIDNGSQNRIMEAYSDIYNNEFVMGTLHLIPQILDTDLNEDKIRRMFKHNPEYYDDLDMLAHNVKTSEEISFVIEGRKFTLPPGWYNTPINSFKPSEDQVIQDASIGSFEHVETFPDDQGLIKVIKFKYPKSSIATPYSGPNRSAANFAPSMPTQGGPSQLKIG